MPSFGSTTGNVAYLIVCGAPPARQAPRSVAVLQDVGWDVCVIATPVAVAWIDTAALSTATGHAVRSELRGPDEAEFDPRGDAVLVAPATFNTINKCALGASDSLALGLMNEALGTGGLPIALVPWVNAVLAGHPAYEPSLGRLRGAGAHIVTPESGDPDGFDGALQQAVEWLASASGQVRPQR